MLGYISAYFSVFTSHLFQSSLQIKRSLFTNFKSHWVRALMQDFIWIIDAVLYSGHFCPQEIMAFIFYLVFEGNGYKSFNQSSVTVYCKRKQPTNSWKPGGSSVTQRWQKPIKKHCTDVFYSMPLYKSYYVLIIWFQKWINFYTTFHSFDDPST